MTDSADKTVLREHRWFATEQEAAVHNWRMDRGLPRHVAPFSTLIACMGNHWEPDCYEAVYKMYEYTNNEGYLSTFYEQQDLCFYPFDGIGLMRNEAYMKAITEGFEYILYVDNDVKPPEDALVKMLHRMVPIVAPIPQFWDGGNHHLTAPQTERNQGLAMVTSTIISFMLFKTSVFMPWSTGGFWESEIGAHEGYHFQKLRLVGHQPFVDTNVVVEIMKPPHFPLDNRPTEPKREPLEVDKLWRP